ncbi:Rz-like lysis system protein LysB [Stutzerimonas kunmingensis]|uniref:Rz-like lysis system protein LysB n=1 Tax=Stutzerimonas kunmingensis TaxID=1211807 RepID=UPI00210583B2|nr:Rz-like lysis system protein LysB [Stutzerimonas kunmingensis]MCQ2035172.1 Rz-like lysis system protein LysB [Stutzerimonas kunmingensis]
MTSGKVWLAVAGVIVALLVAVNFQAQRIDAANARADLAAERLQIAQQRNANQAATITRLTGEVAAQRLDQLGLQQTLSDLRQAQATDQLKKKERRREDPTHATWAAQPLPDAARRLHQRPAITGAAGYRQWLSSRDALHAGPGGTGQ